jgi:hypothetical protein
VIVLGTKQVMITPRLAPLTPDRFEVARLCWQISGFHIDHYDLGDRIVTDNTAVPTLNR